MRALYVAFLAGVLYDSWHEGFIMPKYEDKGDTKKNNNNKKQTNKKEKPRKTHRQLQTEKDFFNHLLILPNF